MRWSSLESTSNEEDVWIGGRGELLSAMMEDNGVRKGHSQSMLGNSGIALQFEYDVQCQRQTRSNDVGSG